MVSKITFKGKSYNTDLSKPIDISIPLRAGEENVNAWYTSPVKIEPVRMGDWVGDVKQGGSVNFRNITFNPHGNGTHTECVGHISKEDYSVNQSLKKFFFIAELITILPEENAEGDRIITKEHIQNCLGDKRPEALVLRTLDNHISKINKQYSNTNPPYLHPDAAAYIDELGIDHLLIDLPSVDKEVDGGKLLAHHAFWQYPHNTQVQRTITEMIYVPNTIFDGTYLLNLQIASFENDASPSKPVLYQLNVAL
ncbi:MAG: Metal-dependent hydrolase [Bacteroidetes bacterium]|nr:Metal-dependent hydrolase [Bacteroidota bacterium]